jgi:hypothetical protein
LTDAVREPVWSGDLVFLELDPLGRSQISRNDMRDYGLPVQVGDVFAAMENEKPPQFVDRRIGVAIDL